MALVSFFPYPQYRAVHAAFLNVAMAATMLLPLQTKDGAIVRGPSDARRLAIVFTGHEFAEGGETILNELHKHKAKASFFLTGDFLANTNFAALVQRIIKEGHYLGPHSDKHLLYCAWEPQKKTLVTKEQFSSDLEANRKKIERAGFPRDKVRFFLPPYEHYNRQIAEWTHEMRIVLVNYTPDTRSNADYTGETEKNFVSSKAIFDSIIAKEREDQNGLNGFLLLLHIGSGPGRKDKFHARFGELLDYLDARGYTCVRVDELMKGK